MSPEMEPFAQGSVIITPTEMYREMQDIGKKVDHLAAVVDPALAMVREDILGIKRDLAVGTSECLNDTKAMGLRVTALEHWRWFILGATSIVGAGGGYLVAFFLN